MKFVPALSLLLAASPALADRSTPFGVTVNRRGFVYNRDTGSCTIPISTHVGGRKLAIVIDASSSTAQTDPNNLRITAGQELNDHLVTAADATTGTTPDLVTVIKFNDNATILYPLGDPSGADSVFSEIGSSGGTSIAEGINDALTELNSAGSGETAGRSGIVVITDGEDKDVAALTAAIVAAGEAGVRVSFGFLADSTSSYSSELLSDILATGGTYVSFSTPAAIQSFLFLQLADGLTDLDAPTSGLKALLPGVKVAGSIPAGGADAGFVYGAVAGETVAFSVASESQQALYVRLEDSDGVLDSAATGADGSPAVVRHTSPEATTLRLVVSPTNSTEAGVIQVSVVSSLGISGCNLATVPLNGTDSADGNGTATAGPSSVPDTTVTAVPVDSGVASASATATVPMSGEGGGGGATAVGPIATGLPSGKTLVPDPTAKPGDPGLVVVGSSTYKLVNAGGATEVGPIATGLPLPPGETLVPDATARPGDPDLVVVGNSTFKVVGVGAHRSTVPCTTLKAATTHHAAVAETTTHKKTSSSSHHTSHTSTKTTARPTETGKGLYVTAGAGRTVEVGLGAVGVVLVGLLL